jgi:hypothetical protein
MPPNDRFEPRLRNFRTASSTTISAKIISHRCYVAPHMVEVAIPKDFFLNGLR